MIINLTYKLYHFIFTILLLYILNIANIPFDFPSFNDAIAMRIGSDNNSIFQYLQSSQHVPLGLERIGGGYIPHYFSSVDVDVAIIDTGIDSNHPDLNVYNEITFIDSTTEDRCGHGTHVAGIIGAKNNEMGIVGVAPDARIWNLKVSDCGSPSISPIAGFRAVLSALDYVIDNSDEIDILNISQNQHCPTLFCDNTEYRERIDQIVNSGIVVIASAGNNGGFADEYVPPQLENVITVSAISDTDGRCGGLGPISRNGDPDDTFAKVGFGTQSNFGDAVDLAAPGIEIISTLPNGEYGFKSGTSMAAPYVAGTAALLKSINNDSSPEEIKNEILDFASTFQTECDFESLGYFNGDVDQNPEPLLYIKEMLGLYPVE
jgi:subtilisin family serine protease